METALLKQYTADFPDLMKIIVCSDNSLVLCSSDNKIIKHVIPNGDSLKEISVFNLLYIDVALTYNGDFLISTEDLSHMKVIHRETRTVKDVPQYCVSKGTIITIHLDDEREKILLGVCMNQYKEPGQVIVMDHSGRHESKYQYSSSRLWLFQTPGSIATNSSYIAVVDRGDIYQKGDSGSVVIIDRLQEKVINTYKGHIDTYKTGYHPFRPFDIVSTKSNNYIVTDSCIHNPILHVLNSEGKFLTCCNTRNELGITLPCTLSIDNKNGLLYIGSRSYRGAYHTNFYIVMYDGC